MFYYFCAKSVLIQTNMTQRDKNIIVCWHDNETGRSLKEKYAASQPKVTVCTNRSEFLALGDEELRKANGFIVSCELQWSHQSNRCSLTAMSGIRLVREELRIRLGTTAPVVFVSVLTQDEIMKIHPDAGIVKTPALQHEFVKIQHQTTSFKNDLLALLGKMRPQTSLELRYTQQIYCDLKGMLSQIKHSIRQDPERCRMQLRYLVEKRFQDDPILKQQLDDTSTDLAQLCQSLANKLADVATADADGFKLNPEFACDHDQEPLKILILEDNSEDVHVNRFRHYIGRMVGLYKKEGKTFLFKGPTIINTEQELDKQMAKNYDVVICDIEIRDKDGLLVSLGFNILDRLSARYSNPIYYIVTNVTRSFYDQIKIPGVKRIRLKEEVFGSEQEIERFLYGIKEIKEHDGQTNDASKNKYLPIFRIMDGHIHNAANYPITFKKKTEFGATRFDAFDELEACVRAKSEDLIKEFLRTTCSFTDGDVDRLETKFDFFTESQTSNNICEYMRNHISKTITLGNENFVKKFDFAAPITADETRKYVIRLVLRQFFLYLRRFVMHYGLNKFEDYIEQNLTIDDIASRVISGQYKGDHFQQNPKLKYFGSIEKANQPGKCLFYTLLYSPEMEEHQQLTIEEKVFVESLEKVRDKVFRFDDEAAINAISL